MCAPTCSTGTTHSTGRPRGHPIPHASFAQHLNALLGLCKVCLQTQGNDRDTNGCVANVPTKSQGVAIHKTSHAPGASGSSSDKLAAACRHPHPPNKAPNPASSKWFRPTPIQKHSSSKAKDSRGFPISREQAPRGNHTACCWFHTACCLCNDHTAGCWFNAYQKQPGGRPVWGLGPAWHSSQQKPWTFT